MGQLIYRRRTGVLLGRVTAVAADRVYYVDRAGGGNGEVHASEVTVIT